jgi:hypothetical protein
VWPAILVAYAWMFDDRRRWRHYLPALAVVAGWALVYPHILRALYPGDKAGFLVDLHPGPLLMRLSAYLLSFTNLLVPDLNPDREGWAIPPAVESAAFTVPALLLAVVVPVGAMAAAVAATLRPASLPPSLRALGFGLCWFLLGLGPFVILADRLFMRYAYVAHAGLALAAGGVIALALEGLARRRRPVAPSPDLHDLTAG